MTHHTDTNESKDSASQGHWPEVLAALNTSNYERVADLLRVIDTSAHNSDQTGLIQIALQVCLACIHCRSEIEWHRQGGQEADEREHELRHGLETMLAAIINTKGEQQSMAKLELPRDLLSPPSRKLSALELRKSLGIWKRIQAFLGFQREEVSSTDDEDLLPPLEEDGHRIAPPTKEERVDHPTEDVERVTINEVHRLQGGAPSLVIYCLGTFRVYQNEQPVEEWPSNKSKSIFKYLLTHRERPIAKEVLMDLFWPDADPDSARNNLNVAIYGLRQTLRNGKWEFSHVLFQNDSYQLNPKLRFWVDHETFMKGMLTAQSLEHQGKLEDAIRELTSAEAIYQGEFLQEDRYEEWLLPQRQRLQEAYLKLLDRLTGIYYEQHDLINCVNLCLKMLAIDPCQEEAHRLLMRCYYSQGQAYLALRQYHICSEALKNELDIVPSKATRELYEMMQGHHGAR